jgi:hypothetical protein
MTEVQGVRRQPLLTAVCVLLSAHFAIAYTTLTAAMVSFHTYKDLNGDGGPFAPASPALSKAAHALPESSLYVG